VSDKKEDLKRKVVAYLSAGGRSGIDSERDERIARMTLDVVLNDIGAAHDFLQAIGLPIDLYTTRLNDGLAMRMEMHNLIDGIMGHAYGLSRSKRSEIVAKVEHQIAEMIFGRVPGPPEERPGDCMVDASHCAYPRCPTHGTPA
jgi:hypothetical protein